MENFLPSTVNEWILASVVFLAYLILGVGIFKKKNTDSLSFFTNFLWTILDILVLVTSVEEKSSCSSLALGCVLGSFSITLLLLKYDKKKKWGQKENLTSILIGVIVFFWLYSGSSLLGLTLAVIAEIIAGWPQMKESWIKPGSRFTLASYILFLIVYIIYIFDSPNWQLENVMFPIAFFIYCIGDTLPLIIKWWKIEKRYKMIKGI